MGYQVYWNGRRWCGYGVPAYCDYRGCRNEIDRGVYYMCEAMYSTGDAGDQIIHDEGCRDFFCDDHADHNEFHDYVEESPEHPEWVHHVLTDETWERWRQENPSKVQQMKEML